MIKQQKQQQELKISEICLDWNELNINDESWEDKID